MDRRLDAGGEPASIGYAPGIVIHDRFEPVIRPSILAFIWGGKVRPVPELPFGRVTA
jgi:hypothetical protein